MTPAHLALTARLLAMQGMTQPAAYVAAMIPQVMK